MLVLVGSDREQGERGSGLGASDRRTRSMVYSVTDKGRRRKRRCAKSQRTSLFLSFLDPSKPKPTKTTKNKIPSQRPNEATRKTQFPISLILRPELAVPLEGNAEWFAVSSGFIYFVRSMESCVIALIILCLLYTSDAADE